MSDLETTRDANGALTTRTHMPSIAMESPKESPLEPYIQELMARRRLEWERKDRARYPNPSPPQTLAPPGVGRTVMPPTQSMPSYRPTLGQAPVSRSVGVQEDMPRYSYAFQPFQSAGTAPVLPTFVGRGREGRDFIMEGGPQNWRGAPVSGQERPGPADPVAIRRQEMARGIASNGWK